jgi:hypothetical protein
MTRWFVLPRFGSCKPTPRWGGHKDQVSFNLFPLSNGHLDRVSFLLNQMGHLDPIRTTTQLMSLALITSHLRIRMGIEESTIAKAKRQERQITHRSLSLSQVTNTNDHLSQLWNLERLEALIVSWNGLLALVLNVKDCLGEVNGGGWGCIYSPQPLPSRCSNSANRGRSALLVRTVHPCTSTAGNATISSNGYINGYFCI